VEALNYFYCVILSFLFFLVPVGKAEGRILVKEVVETRGENPVEEEGVKFEEEGSRATVETRDSIEEGEKEWEEEGVYAEEEEEEEKSEFDLLLVSGVSAIFFTGRTLYFSNTTCAALSSF
jgi:hypothetical protein